MADDKIKKPSEEGKRSITKKDWNKFDKDMDRMFGKRKKGNRGDKN